MAQQALKKHLNIKDPDELQRLNYLVVLSNGHPRWLEFVAHSRAKTLSNWWTNLRTKVNTWLQAKAIYPMIPRLLMPSLLGLEVDLTEEPWYGAIKDGVLLNKLPFSAKEKKSPYSSVPHLSVIVLKAWFEYVLYPVPPTTTPASLDEQSSEAEEREPWITDDVKVLPFTWMRLIRYGDERIEDAFWHFHAQWNAYRLNCLASLQNTVSLSKLYQVHRF